MQCGLQRSSARLRKQHVVSHRRGGPARHPPETRETYGNGVRKAVYRAPDGNEVDVGGAPISSH